MNIEVEMRDGIGPYIPQPINNKAALDQVILPDVEEHLGYVFEAVRMTKSVLNDRVPLIGFAGAPWTLLCYAVQGQGSKILTVPKPFVSKNLKWPKNFYKESPPPP